MGIGTDHGWFSEGGNWFLQCCISVCSKLRLHLLPERKEGLRCGEFRWADILDACSASLQHIPSRSGMRVPQPGLGRQNSHQRLVGACQPGESSASTATTAFKSIRDEGLIIAYCPSSLLAQFSLHI